MVELQNELPPELAGIAGHYLGKTKVWADPGSQTPDESDSELHVSSVCGGHWLRLEDRGSFQGKARAGEMTLGFHKDAQRFDLSWIDSFHTGSSIMQSQGLPLTDGLIEVTGSFTAGDETWGWRTEFDTRNGFVMRAFNISPTGEERIAVETNWTR